jgi:hypothetical protein
MSVRCSVVKSLILDPSKKACRSKVKVGIYVFRLFGRVEKERRTAWTQRELKLRRCMPLSVGQLAKEKPSKLEKCAESLLNGLAAVSFSVIIGFTTSFYRHRCISFHLNVYSVSLELRVLFESLRLTASTCVDQCGFIGLSNFTRQFEGVEWNSRHQHDRERKKAAGKEKVLHYGC